jgi:predicted DNA-binding protein
MGTQNKVRTLVGKIILGREYIHVQTVKISQEHHHRLMALTSLSDRTKTALGADLLEAAIDDAIEALPDDVRQRVKHEASESYRRFLWQQKPVPAIEAITPEYAAHLEHQQVVSEALDDYYAGRLPDEAYQQ